MGFDSRRINISLYAKKITLGSNSIYESKTLKCLIKKYITPIIAYTLQR